jgi:Pyruvate:ferredoxin oxidoreductase and related 2-oxoacid:ferredoxin oxidoreductases, beta subunit
MTEPLKIAGASETPLNLQRTDFISDQEVRWCPGCGDYSILFQVQSVLPKLNIPRENLVFVSGMAAQAGFHIT